MPDGFTEVDDGSLNARNDYIEHMFVGDSSDGRIVARASNSLMRANEWQDIKCNYIAKCWKSGITEFYIYLPTTYTYYIPHVPGASYCTAGLNEIKIRGKTIVPEIAENTTSVQISILSSWFWIDTVLENTIKCNSLPLNVFKDHDDYY